MIYPHPPVSKTDQAEKIFVDMIKKHNIELVAIGNGTASRESEQFVAEMIKSMTYLANLLLSTKLVLQFIQLQI